MDFNNSGAMRSPFSPRVRQTITGRRPIGLSSAKKNQSKFMQPAGEPRGDVIYKTPMSTVETYGQPLPVMVTETLAFASGEVSVRLSPCGWCWVVSGRRVLAWPLSATPAAGGSLAARELTLPQTDLAHKADLVVLFYEDGAQMPSCIGVSPEGVVRYWGSVGQEGVFTDVSAELAGQECERLGEPSEAGLLLATTTCTVVLLNPALVEGRATVSCRTLRPPSGWLGGIGRRVSVLFFGSMPAHADTKLVGAVVVPMEEGSEACIALVARGPVLQVWRAGELHEHSLRRALTEAHARAHLAPHGDLSTLEVVALDVLVGGTAELVLLVAAVNVARSPDMRYAIAYISLEDPAAPRVTSLVALRSGPAGGAAPRLLPLPTRALLYTNTYIALVSTVSSVDKAEYIDVSADGDRILGAALCEGAALVFSRKHGVLALSCTDNLPPGATPSMCESPLLGSPCPSDMYDGNLSLYEIDPHEVSMVTTDACGKLKTAFLFHLRRDMSACRAILHELFPSRASPAPPHPSPPSPSSPPSSSNPPVPPERDVDSVLDRTVLKIATEMLDDIPAGDPRWVVAERTSSAHTSIALGRSGALQLTAQLRDKQRAFSLFLDFLRATGLWRRLGLVTREGGEGCVPSEVVLGSLAESLAAAVALRRLHQGQGLHAQLIDAAVYQVVCGSPGAGGGGGGAEEETEDPEIVEAVCSGALAAADACFRRVSRATRVLRALAAAPRPHHQPAPHAIAVLHVINTVLSEMHKCRSKWDISGGVTAGAAAGPALGPRALLPALADLLKKVLSECSHNCSDANQRAQVVEAAARLAALLVAEASRLPKQLYRRYRREAIRPFLAEGHREVAAALADKFAELELLVDMCISSGDIDALHGYIEKYADKGMAEIAFSSLAQRGGAHIRTLVETVGAGQGGARVAAWARRAAARRPVLALKQLATEPRAAAAVLADMAEDETDSVNRMMTMASIAKLCMVASEDFDSQPSDTWRKIENRLALGEQHEALPRDIRLHNGLDDEDTKVMRPEDLVQMYVDSESKTLSEYDYKKALDLTDYIDDMELRDDLRLQVWCACIRRDAWSSPRDHAALHDKMFFRLVDLVHLMGGDLELMLPPVEDILTSRSLSALAAEPAFHYCIKYGYECLHHSDTDQSMEQ